MRKIKLFFCITAVVTAFFLSCSKKDDSLIIDIESENIADIQNATEETVIPTSTLNSGISIENASKETGTPPAPNSDLDFKLDTSLTEGFQSTGFNIKFSSTSQVSGAYILFKDSDGNTLDDYYNVPLSSFNYYSRKRLITSSKNAVTVEAIELETQEADYIIEIDFDSTVPPGQFCYDICLYDAQDNISQIQTVCVTVEAWGGNASIVGEWEFDRNETENIKETFECDYGNEIVADYIQYIEREGLLLLNEDGSFEITNNIEYRTLDYNAIEENNCTVAYNESVVFSIKNSGNWAFNVNNQTLTTIFFRYEDFLNPDNNEEYEQGQIDMEGVHTDIISGQLVLSTTDDDGNTSTAYYNRK